MEWRADLESTCAALGSYDGVHYYKDPECLECVKDLIRFLRRDDATHVIRRVLGNIGVVSTDLIPLLREYSNDEELFDLVLRLLVNLTGPELLLFREELPEEKVTRNYFIELQTYRQKYKQSFIDEKLWAILAQSLGKLLKKEYAERSEDDGLVIERILILIRNILDVPRDASRDNRTDDEASIHDQVLWVLHKSGIEDLLLFIATSDEETQYCHHVLEIISLMFREQDAKTLALSDFQRSKEEKKEDEQELLKLRMKQMEIQKKKFHQIKSSRHSRFGGTFTLANMKSISENNVIYHRPLTSMDNIDFDKEKKPKKVARNKRMPENEGGSTRRSTLAIRLFLKEFCVEFLHGAYNNLMSVVRDNVVRHKAQSNDETYYLWAIRFFMEFNRQLEKFRPELVIETLNKSTFHFVQSQIEIYKDNFEHEKKNRPMCLIWGRRMHLALNAYKELLMNIVTMVSSKDEKIKDSGLVLRADVFYEPEYRELCLTQLGLFSPEKMSLAHLKDLVEATHVFLKLMEHMSKSSHIMVSSKKVKKKSSKPKMKLKEDGNFATERESKEEIWDKISSQLSALIQANAVELPEIMAPFDAASEIPVEEQKSHAMYKIHQALLNSNPGLGLALLRASRQVWPENDVFGPQEADPEDEFMAMREILLADIPKPKDLIETEQAPNEEADNILDQPEIEEEEEDEEEEEVMVTQKVEQEFNFNIFAAKFAVKSVCAAYAILLANYEKNSDHTNHCIIKMFHRIAFDLQLPGLLFHFSILRVFQKIHRDYGLNPANTCLRDMNRFAKFMLQKFFEVSQNNKHIWMEICFWKNSREAAEVVDGYGTQVGLNQKQKASYWCEEDEEKLTRVFHQLKQMEFKDEGNDMLDGITAFFTDAGKSRRQVARKLKEMALISNINEVTKKPLKMRAPREWGEEEIEQLTKLYAEFKEAMDPVNRILEQLTIKRPKKRVVEKIMDLGLCDDKKKLMKKRVRRGLKEGDQGYLQSASESDSALESSGSEEDDEASESESDIEKSNLDGPKAMISELISEKEQLMPALMWLKSSLEDEKEDRQDDNDIQDVPLVAIKEECLSAMENAVFIKLLKSLQMAAPNDQEQYWRIPSCLGPESLASKIDFLQALTQDSVELETLNLSIFQGNFESSQNKSKKKKKREKRGPNKWMPMRRAVDADVAQRISEAAGVTNKENSPKSATKKKRTPAKTRKKILRNSDSSSDDEKDNSAVQEDADANQSKNSSNASQGRLKIDDSSSSDDERSKAAGESSYVNRSVLDSTSSSDEENQIEAKTKESASKKSNQSRFESSSDEEMGKVEEPKNDKDGDSSSDDGVDDPWPTARVPSDDEEKNDNSVMQRSSRSTSRASSISSRSSSSSPVRWRSVSRSPSPMVAPTSSTSNTPKRPRSSPSPQKADKKARRARVLDSSDDE